MQIQLGCVGVRPQLHVRQLPQPNCPAIRDDTDMVVWQRLSEGATLLDLNELSLLSDSKLCDSDIFIFVNSGLLNLK